MDKLAEKKRKARIAQKAYYKKNREKILLKARNGLPPKTIWRKSHEFDEAVALYQSGKTIREVQKITGIQPILAELIRRGIPRRDSKEVNRYTKEQRVAAKIKRQNLAKAYFQANKDRIMVIQKARPIEVVRAQRRKSAKKNYIRNKPKRIESEYKRRAGLRNASSDPRGIAEYVTLIKSKPCFRCYYCERLFSSMDVCFDHVFPVAKHGPNSLWNLAATCVYCNSSKRDRLISKWKIKGQLMLEL